MTSQPRGPLPQHQRVAAYAVIRRVLDGGQDEILLSRIAERIYPGRLWTLPGGGLDHGEDPRDAVVREVYEETSLSVVVGDQPRVYSAFLPGVRREGRLVDSHALRIVYEGWVPKDSLTPRVVEIDGSTVEAAWHPLSAVLDGEIQVVQMVTDALSDLGATRVQRLAAYALVRRGEGDDAEVLLSRISARGFHSGAWTLPGGGVEHGEAPADAVVREVREECGLEASVGELLDVHDVHFTGTAPSGRLEDFHGVHLLFAAHVAPDAEPHVVETDGTTDAVAFVRVRDVVTGVVPTTDMVRRALAGTEHRDAAMADAEAQS
ncbi:NUDIX domain-containing protein [Nocardioides yefusunii]|uniref:NUDIX domain-containing protein n=1 Tax=Nocardioides yefusunii TaxID=2500546 RepID=A0ABW1QXW3_9ACTN|nr:NUDIX domain-containing protein [Nocardioides yefusunii]